MSNHPIIEHPETNTVELPPKAPQIPKVGDRCLYRLSKHDANVINKRRRDASEKMAWHTALNTGAQLHVGNEAEEGQVYPMLIARVWGGTPDSAVNGQVFLDGNDGLWVTSISVGRAPGSFAWPEASHG